MEPVGVWKRAEPRGEGSQKRTTERKKGQRRKKKSRHIGYQWKEAETHGHVSVVYTRFYQLSPGNSNNAFRPTVALFLPSDNIPLFPLSLSLFVVIR